MFEPTLEEVHVMIYNTYKKILAVNHEFPRLETIMFPGNNDLRHVNFIPRHVKLIETLPFLEFSEEKWYLHEVFEDDEYVSKVINKGLSIFEPNTIGPQTYLNIYEEYLYLLDGEARKSLDDFMSEDPFPFLRVKFFIKIMSKYLIF